MYVILKNSTKSTDKKHISQSPLSIE